MGDLFKILSHNPFRRIFQFVIGIMLWDLIRDFSLINKKGLKYISIVVGVFAYFGIISDYIYLADTVSAMIFVVTIYICRKSNPLSSKLLVACGKISLYLYLLHYPIVCYGGAFCIKYWPKNLYVIALEMIILFVVSVLIACVWHKIIINTKIY